MIVIVEGVDRVGKTTLCRLLEKTGFTYFKDEWNFLKLNEGESASMGKIDTTISIISLLAERGENVVLDRFHYTEAVYGELQRGNVMSSERIASIENRLRAIDEVKLVHVCPEDLYAVSEEAGFDVAPYVEKFTKLIGDASIDSHVISYNGIEKMAKTLSVLSSEYDFYFASPFFSEEQVEREEALKALLREKGYTVFSPKEHFLLSPDSSMLTQIMVFNDNLRAIKRSRAVFAVTDGKDVGTIWEAGYAYGINKPILYFCESLNGAPFNVMLAQSGMKVFTSREEISSDIIDIAIRGNKYSYRGEIQ